MKFEEYDDNTVPYKTKTGRRTRAIGVTEFDVDHTVCKYVKIISGVVQHVDVTRNRIQVQRCI